MGEEKKKPAPLALFFSTLYTHHVNGKNPKPAFSELYLSAWLLEKTSVVQMWDGKSGLHWHRPCGCFGAGAQSAVGYRCLLSTINVANMWNHGTHNTTQRSTPLIVWEITPLKKFLLEGLEYILVQRVFFVFVFFLLLYFCFLLFFKIFLAGWNLERNAWWCWSGPQRLIVGCLRSWKL